jgi:hypothetical protein
MPMHGRALPRCDHAPRADPHAHALAISVQMQVRSLCPCTCSPTKVQARTACRSTCARSSNQRADAGARPMPMHRRAPPRCKHAPHADPHAHALTMRVQMTMRALCPCTGDPYQGAGTHRVQIQSAHALTISAARRCRCAPCAHALASPTKVQARTACRSTRARSNNQRADAGAGSLPVHGRALPRCLHVPRADPPHAGIGGGVGAHGLGRADGGSWGG